MFTTYSPPSAVRQRGDKVGLDSGIHPVRRPRAQLTPTACIRCRAKKIKCTGEPQGCRTCQSKDVQCVYPDPLSSARQVSSEGHQQAFATTTTSTTKAPMSAVHQAPDIRAACSGSRTDEFLMPDATGGTIEHMDLSNIFSQRAMDALEASLAPAPELLPPPYNQYFGPSSPDQQQQEQQPKYSAKRPKASVAALPTPFDTPSYGSFSHSSSEGSRLSDLEVGGRQADAGSSDNDSETDCTSCVEKMLEAFERVHLETAQRKVLWRSSTPQDGGQRDSLAMDSRLLYYQKVLMSTGETMLGCSHCMSRSVALILIASLGDAVLDTIDLMLGMTEGKEGDEERARRDCHQGRDQQRLRDTIALMGDRGGGYDGLREDRSDSGAEGTGGSGLDCFLDQKDRQVVIKALLGCRLVQLHTLLGQIDRMIHNQARTAQKAILRNTLARLQTYSSMYSVG